jgi:hypothetical protein
MFIPMWGLILLLFVVYALAVAAQEEGRQNAEHERESLERWEREDPEFGLLQLERRKQDWIAREFGDYR